MRLTNIYIYVCIRHCCRIFGCSKSDGMYIQSVLFPRGFRFINWWPFFLSCSINFFTLQYGKKGGWGVKLIVLLYFQDHMCYVTTKLVTYVFIGEAVLMRLWFLKFLECLRNCLEHVCVVWHVYILISYNNSHIIFFPYVGFDSHTVLWKIVLHSHQKQKSMLCFALHLCCG